jgi:hypothetical protein
MSLDFNTPEYQGLQGTQNHFPGQSDYSQDNIPRYIPSTLTSLMILTSILISIAGLSVSIYTISNIPEPKPVILACEPGLQQKLVNEVKTLQEIAGSIKSTK